MAGMLDSIAKGGFSFENCKRNEALMLQGFKPPKATKTGTTIAGIIFKDGVVLGADTRATSDTIVADKNCSKIHRISDSIFCCGAGTAADTERTTKMIESNLELMKLNTGRPPRVVAANRMTRQYLFRYGGHVSAALVLGGVDVTGSYLYCIYPHGSSSALPFVTMGSGSLAAMAVFESRYRINMERQEAMQLVHDAIAAGIFNDLGSGSNVDLCVITKEKTDYLRPFNVATKKGIRQGEYKYAKGTTMVISETVEILEDDILGTEVDTPCKTQEQVKMITA